MIDLGFIFEIGMYILTGIFALLWAYAKYNTIPKTMEQLSASIEAGRRATDTIKSIVAFFDPSKPMSDTPLDVIDEYIPATTYQMSDESQARVLSYCASEEEKRRVLSEIYNWENPKSNGEECCEYTLVTSGATFRVQWGVPEIVSLAKDTYVYLTQKQIAEITGLVKQEEAVDVLYEILSNERRLNREYEIEISDGKIRVSNGNYELIN